MKTRFHLAAGAFAAAVLGVGYAYGVAAPARHVRELQAALADTNRDLSAARESIQQVRELERQSAAIRTQLARRDHAATSPVFWFPEQMTKYFGIYGLQNVSTRVNTALPEPGLTNFQRTFWSVAVPLSGDSAELDQTLLAISELEADDPLLRVHSVAATASTAPHALVGPTATVTVSLLTRQF